MASNQQWNALMAFLSDLSFSDIIDLKSIIENYISLVIVTMKYF